MNNTPTPSENKNTHPDNELETSVYITLLPETTPLPNINTLRAFNPHVTKTGLFYVKTPEEDLRFPLIAFADCGVKTLEEARALAEALSRSAEPSQKWHQIIMVTQSHTRSEGHSLIAEHRIGYGWMTPLIGSKFEPYLDWKNIDPGTTESRLLKMAAAAIEAEAKNSVLCPNCGTSVHPPFQRPRQPYEYKHPCQPANRRSPRMYSSFICTDG